MYQARDKNEEFWFIKPEMLKERLMVTEEIFSKRIAPQLSEAPALDQQKGMLHLKGYFPGQPVQINFDILYQAVGGRWRGVRTFGSAGKCSARASLGRHCSKLLGEQEIVGHAMAYPA